jgi:hypothetical protein
MHQETNWAERGIPWKERDIEALSWFVNVEPPPLKFGDLFEPHVPEYVSAELSSSYVVFDTVALHGRKIEQRSTWDN